MIHVSHFSAWRPRHVCVHTEIRARLHYDFFLLILCWWRKKFICTSHYNGCTQLKYCLIHFHLKISYFHSTKKNSITFRSQFQIAYTNDIYNTYYIQFNIIYVECCSTPIYHCSGQMNWKYNIQIITAAAYITLIASC